MAKIFYLGIVTFVYILFSVSFFFLGSRGIAYFDEKSESKQSFLIEKVSFWSFNTCTNLSLVWCVSVEFFAWVVFDLWKIHLALHILSLNSRHNLTHAMYSKQRSSHSNQKNAAFSLSTLIMSIQKIPYLKTFRRAFVTFLYWNDFTIVAFFYFVWLSTFFFFHFDEQC